MQEVRIVELEEPMGWTTVRLVPEDSRAALKVFFVQIAVLTNHQNGRDTHVRQVRIYGPRAEPHKALGLPCSMTTVPFSSYASVR
jgi:anaphase-promoting complex subunit 10